MSNSHIKNGLRGKVNTCQWSLRRGIRSPSLQEVTIAGQVHNLQRTWLGLSEARDPSVWPVRQTSVNAASRAAHVKADQLVSEGQWTFFEWVRL